MLDIQDYVVVERTEEDPSVGIELWVEFLPGVDGLAPQSPLRAQSFPDRNGLVFKDAHRCMVGLNPSAWDAIIRTGKGVLIVCGPSGVVWSAPWILDPVSQ